MLTREVNKKKQDLARRKCTRLPICTPHLDYLPT